MSYLIAKAIHAQSKDPEEARKLAELVSGNSPDLSGHIKFVDSNRHTGYANKDTYVAEMKKFRRKMGWPDLEKDHYIKMRS